MDPGALIAEFCRSFKSFLKTVNNVAEIKKKQSIMSAAVLAV